MTETETTMSSLLVRHQRSHGLLSAFAADRLRGSLDLFHSDAARENPPEGVRAGFCSGCSR